MLCNSGAVCLQDRNVLRLPVVVVTDTGACLVLPPLLLLLLLCQASCTSTVEASVVRQLRMQQPLMIKGGFNRPNIQYKVGEQLQTVRVCNRFACRHAGWASLQHAWTAAVSMALHRTGNYHRQDMCRLQHKPKVWLLFAIKLQESIAQIQALIIASDAMSGWLQVEYKELIGGGSEDEVVEVSR
jgi:hypothetical protein